MGIKEIVTKESLSVAGFNLSTFSLFAFLIFILLVIFLYIKRKQISFTDGIRCGFITLSIITFFFAFLKALTGEDLFSQSKDITTYMFIAAIAIFLSIVDSIKELFK